MRAYRRLIAFSGWRYYDLRRDISMETMPPLGKDYQRSFIEFLISCGSLTFGDFTLKSGRKAPYFINTGKFNTGSSITMLGRYYAAHMIANKLAGAATVFGPAYKGIPLCVTTAAALSAEHGVDIGFTFNRKEAKDHGDSGMFVGYAVKPGDRIVIVEDVISAGTTLRQVVPEVRALLKADIGGVVISVDRQERGTGARSALREAEEELGLKVFPIVTISDILAYLKSGANTRIDKAVIPAIEGYLKQYGAN
jgi:orotate phosphoribosyltransferase